MKRITTFLIAILGCICLGAQVPHRFAVPDVEGYLTLTADTHIHSIFSSCGATWPTNRVDEAYMEGLEVIFITDHLELFRKLYGPDFEDRNKSYELACDRARSCPEVMVIRGAEITRGMPPGHFNALFTTDNNPLAKASLAHGGYLRGDEVAGNHDACVEAKKQDAFLVWNHPDWAGNANDLQAPNETLWHKEQTKLLKEGLMDGIEIYNNRYCPEAFGWALKYNLTLVSGTDVHSPIYMDVDFANGAYRPCTLVFAKEKTEEAIKEAFVERRTAVTADGMVWGRERELVPLVDAIVRISDVKAGPSHAAHFKWTISCKLKNNSSIPVWIRKGKGNDHLMYSRSFLLAPGEEKGFDVSFWEEGATSVDVNLVIDNFYCAPDTPLNWTMHLKAE